MHRVKFQAFGHENIIGEHKTTVELTSEEFLTLRGSCIVGIRSTLTLENLLPEIKKLARLRTTRIILSMKVKDKVETVTGTGSPGLTYSDRTSMVARTSSFECGRTLMVNGDKAASDLSRDFINLLKEPDVIINCELFFFKK